MPDRAPANKFARPPQAVAVCEASGEIKARPRGAWVATLLAASLAAWAVYAIPPQSWPGFTALRTADGGLKFGPVSARRGEINGQPVLYVEGSLLNSGKKGRKAPALRVTLIGDDGQPLYSWKARAASPQMQATATFQTRLLAPPETFRNIAISFADAG